MNIEYLVSPIRIRASALQHAKCAVIIRLSAAHYSKISIAKSPLAKQTRRHALVRPTGNMHLHPLGDSRGL